MKILKYPEYKFSATVFLGHNRKILFQFIDRYGNILLVPDAKYIVKPNIVLFMKVKDNQPVIDYSYSTLRRYSREKLPDLDKSPFGTRRMRVHSLLE